jgi:hypothetical protein
VGFAKVKERDGLPDAIFARNCNHIRKIKDKVTDSAVVKFSLVQYFTAKGYSRFVSGGELEG